MNAIRFGSENFCCIKTFSPTRPLPPPNPKMPKIMEIFHSALFVLSCHISVPVNFFLQEVVQFFREVTQSIVF